MNILEQVKKEHSKRTCDRIVNYIGDDPHRFKELVEVFLSGPYRVTQRSAWPLSCVIERHPGLIKPHLGKVLKHLERPDTHISVRRNTVRLLQFIDVPKSLQGRVTGICFRYMQDSNEAIAVRCFSMTVLSNISEEQPALRNELKIILEDLLPFATAGIASRAKKVLKEIRRPVPLSEGARGR